MSYNQLKEIKNIRRDYDDSNLIALYLTFDLEVEENCHQALKEILAESFDVENVSITEYDEIGEVFGLPEQIELDIIIKNNLLIIWEMQAWVDKVSVYMFDGKVRFYEKRYHQTVNRKIIISAVVYPKGQEISQKLGIEIYHCARDVVVS
ncbi:MULTISPECIES: DUF3782 domain-containing protein [Spirulina sp. CCY15215]|uniref:DUF3782 domain-containing protein n=1 Tax=Spirulina sp. CCY15215 TaxID=2767591 RepID=UPI00194F5152|nr:DUF3782 domain-containing protein [Spirulina major]